MNHKMIWYIMGQIFKVEAAFLSVSFVVAVIVDAIDGNFGFLTVVAFLVPILILLGSGIPLTMKRPAKRNFYAKEGFFVVAMAWVLMSLVGCIPFMICGKMSFIDAFFETASGFTTTGASVITDLSLMSRGLLFWRSFTHWLGGMGILVFVLAIFPEQETQSIFLMKAESPGPKVGKIVSKLRITARILYGIYIALTLLEFIMLLCGGMTVYDSAVYSFATAGTGGFAVTDVIGNGGFTTYALQSNAYFEWVIGVFMFIFGVNFNVYFLIIVKRVRDAFRSEELWVYSGIVVSSVAFIAINIAAQAEKMYSTFGETLRHSFFTVTSITSSTGFATVDFDAWPTFSKAVLVLLMFIGASAGSTGGGLKVARVMLLIKNGYAELKRCISPNQVVTVKFEGKPIEKEVLHTTNGYLAVFISVLAASTLVVALDSPALDFGSSFTGVLACLNNIGPALGKLGPASNFSQLGVLSKVVLSFDMIAGRLELFPVLLLFSPKTYRN